MSDRDILVIDDDEDYVETLKVILESKNYSVRAAHNGADGWEEAQKKTPDLALVDIMMETFGEGVRLTQRFRSDEKLKDVPIIMISAVNQEVPYHLEEETEEGYLPAQKFMDKPIDPDELLEEIEKLLD